MDYSSYNNDAASSPWASSPQQNKHTFIPNSNDEPLPPPALQPQNQMPYRPSNDRSGVNDFGGVPQLAQEAVSNGHSEQSGMPYKQSQEPAQSDQQYGYAQEQQRQQDGQIPPQQRQHGNRSQHQQRAPAPRYKLQAKVNGLERTGRKDPILRFDVYTNLPSFRTTQFRDVRRTHSEFAKLADHLISANPEALVPAIPPSATPAGVGTDEDEARVKANMQRWLTYVCDDEVLMRDEEIIRFVEGDPGYSPVIKRSQPATGVRRKMLKQFAPPPDDTPELQEARPLVKRFYLGAMDTSQKVDKMVKARRGLSLAESDFGTKLAAMNDIEAHPGLKTAYRKLGKTIQSTGDLHAVQGTSEATTLSDPLQYHSSDAFIVKETLTNRQILMRELVQAQTATRSKLSATDRLKSSSSVRRDKVDEAIAALDEARSHEQYLLQKVQRVTSNLVQERRKWFANTSGDMRASIREYVLREIEFERRALATLEAVRPDIRAIDASGGLSRLGRDPTTVRRTTVISSQGPKGDAWSGVQRRPDVLSRSMSGSIVGAPADGPEPEEASLEAAGDGETAEEGSRQRKPSGAESLKSVQEDDEDRVDARNAASRLAASTF